LGSRAGDQVTLEFSRRALREIERATRLWRENARHDAELFAVELGEAFERIRKWPYAPTVVRLTNGRETRRVLMKKTEYHVYYRDARPGVVLVLSVWGGRRQHEPKL
jgi:hypothetical protein